MKAFGKGRALWSSSDQEASEGESLVTRSTGRGELYGHWPC